MSSPRYQLMRGVFVRSLGVIYAVAFASLGVQIVGLVGESGILPVGDYLAAARDASGTAAYHQLPTLSWLSGSDAWLRAQAWTGFGLALLVVAGISPIPCLVGSWILYLSLSVAGQLFFYYQWDTLLLETGLLAALFAAGGRWRRAGPESAAPDLVRWLLWLLLFKLMFLSGITKILSGDPTWADWSALSFHYQTQPIPSWTSWYAHQLPGFVQHGSLAFMWLAELVAPFVIFVPARLRWLRWGGCGVMIAFQLAIAATGNYGFFNLLTIVLCLTLLDDDVWRRVLPARWVGPASSALPSPPRWATFVRAAIACVLLPLSALVFMREIAFTVPRTSDEAPRLAWTGPLIDWARPFRSVNGYGLFRVLTTERREIAIEGRRREGDWVEYDFRWKPGALGAAPRIAGPHMPRLDWQMWFAGLRPQRHEHWLIPLARRLFDGNPEVRALLAGGPFLDAPPDELRLVAWRYQFTRWGGDGSGGDWWRRERLGDLTGPLTRAELGAVE